MLWRGKKGQSGQSFIKQRGGVTVSKGLAKNERLSSDFILGAIEDGVVMIGNDNLIGLFNPSASRITGWPAEEAVGLEYHSVLPLVNEKGEPYPPDSHPIAKTLVSGQPVRDSRGWLVTRGNKRIPVSVIVSPVMEENGRATGAVVGVFRDITSEQSAESHRTEFISTASHEMRTPIAAIEGYLALTLNEKVTTIDARARSYLEKAHNSTQALGELFADLLTSSKAEDGRLASYPTVVEVGEIVEQVTDTARFNAQKKGLQLKYVVSSNKEVSGGLVVRPLFYAFADPNRLREVLQNLADNAIKYTAEGWVAVALTGNSAVVQIQVKDSGMGIPSEDLPHLFQKFYRVDSTMTRTIGGTGLGLFICRKILELYNGRIWVRSQLGKGSIFYVNLPRLSSSQALEMQKKQAGLVNPQGEF